MKSYRTEITTTLFALFLIGLIGGGAVGAINHGPFGLLLGPMMGTVLVAGVFVLFVSVSVMFWLTWLLLQTCYDLLYLCWPKREWLDIFKRRG